MERAIENVFSEAMLALWEALERAVERADRHRYIDVEIVAPYHLHCGPYKIFFGIATTSYDSFQSYCDCRATMIQVGNVLFDRSHTPAGRRRSIERLRALRRWYDGGPYREPAAPRESTAWLLAEVAIAALVARGE